MHKSLLTRFIGCARQIPYAPKSVCRAGERRKAVRGSSNRGAPAVTLLACRQKYDDTGVAPGDEARVLLLEYTQLICSRHREIPLTAFTSTTGTCMQRRGRLPIHKMCSLKCSLRSRQRTSPCLRTGIVGAKRRRATSWSYTHALLVTWARTCDITYDSFFTFCSAAVFSAGCAVPVRKKTRIVFWPRCKKRSPPVGYPAQRNLENGRNA